LLAIVPPSAVFFALSVLFVARQGDARGIAEWLRARKERYNPEFAMILSTAARNRRATAGSSHDAHLAISTPQTGAVRPKFGFVENRFFIPPRTGHGRPPATINICVIVSL
jgi:hypothetical protein